MKRLDNLFSEYIRRKYADKMGVAKCYTCDYPSHWKNLECGHYWSRRHTSVRWDKYNARPQCTNCNQYLRGNLTKYQIRLLNEIGVQDYNLLVHRMRHDRLDIQDMEQIEYWLKKELENLDFRDGIF